MRADDPREERIQSYLARANEARQQALKAKDPVAKRSFETIAVAWQELAEQLARTLKNRP